MKSAQPLVVLGQQTPADATVLVINDQGGIHLTGLSQVSSAPGATCSGSFQAGWLPAAGRRRRRGLARVLGDDEVLVPDGVVVDGELQHPVEDQAATAGVATVEPEHELVM